MGYNYFAADIDSTAYPGWILKAAFIFMILLPIGNILIPFFSKKKKDDDPQPGWFIVLVLVVLIFGIIIIAC